MSFTARNIVRACPIKYRVRIKEVFRTSCLFVGAVVGAGFATGREIVLFFGDGGVLAPVICGLAMGLFASVFMFTAKFGDDGKSRFVKCVNAVVNVVSAICMFFTVIAMTGGLQELSALTTGYRLPGFIVALLCVCACAGKGEAASKLNSLLIPVLIIMLAVLYAMSENDVRIVPVNVYKAVSYLSMNMLLGGFLVSERGKQSSTKEIIAVGIVSGVCMSVLMFFVYVVSVNYSNAPMPVFAFCESVGIGGAGAIVVAIAIITTLAGAAKTLSNELSKNIFSRKESVIAAVLFTLSSYGWDFKTAVDLFYPLIAAVACVVLALWTVRFVSIVILLLSDKIKNSAYRDKLRGTQKLS